ncbi:Abortive infection protein [Chloroflexus aggregans DSM 9485]|uniref:Abortive infection protein n=2 Tax=Chloroflexus aggregans TaxID=152260 RepID=B8G3L7_CHLAD|nr:Abortive infection protein [Chloroflexus aggregans DSM 9485]
MSGEKMSKHLVVWFYILAFGISWLGWIPTVIGSHGIAPFINPSFQFLLICSAVGPALAAVIVTQIAYGKEQVGNLLKALIQWRVGLVWYLVGLVGPFALLLVAQGVTTFFGLSATQPTPQGDVFSLALATFLMSLFANPWEEVGWRGFARPHLQKRYTAVVATFIVGMLWGLWHLPLFFWKGNPISEYPFLPWFISTVAGSFIYTWLYNSTNGSLLLVTLFHIALNTFSVVISGVSIITLALLEVVVALVLVVIVGGANLSRRERDCAG